MKIIKGTILKVYHKRKGVFCGKAKRDFDTDKEEFYPIILDEPYLAGMNTEYFKGDDVECRDCLCKVEVISLPKGDNNES